MSFEIWFELRPLAEIAPWGAPDQPSLSWYGLTDGFFDLIVNGEPLFDRFDYQVVRLWEDLIAVAPHALEAIPDVLAEELGDVGQFSVWSDTQLGEDVVAVQWWWHRQLATGYLRPQFWRVGDRMHVWWRGGQTSISVDEFRATLQRFDRALIDQMGVRVEAIAQGWDRPIAIDLPVLQLEHAQRATWIERAWRPPNTNWDAVAAAVRRLRPPSHPSF